MLSNWTINNCNKTVEVDFLQPQVNNIVESA